MQKSLFSKYYSVCVTMILVSIATLGVLFTGFASQYFKQDKFNLLSRNAMQAAELTMVNFEENDYLFVSSQTVLQGYSILSNAIDADIFLVDTAGKTLLCTEKKKCNHSIFTIDSDIMNKAMMGEFKELGNLGKIYGDSRYTVAEPMITDGGEVVGVVFVSTSAASLAVFITEILKMFVFSSFAVLLFAFIIIFYVTGRLVRPLQDMVTATESFSKGDFTARVPVDGFDEVGRLAMAFNNMASSLAAFESTRRSFVANVSHELKTPMTTIGGFIDGVLDGTIPPEKERQYLQIVSNEVKRLSRMVRSMLDVAKIEAGEMEISMSPVDINDVILRTVFTFEQSIEEKELEIRGLDTDKVMVMADIDLVHQVIYNLIDNAVKFSNQGGYIEFTYENQGDMVYVGVKNSGDGISKEDMARVFDRFYKTDKSRGLDKNGVGLGLHIVRSIINMHSGEILVRSVQGEYCEFVITLMSAAPKSSQSLFRKTDKSKKIVEQ